VYLYLAVTFDDGYLLHYDVAKSLARMGIKATFFVTTHIRKKPWLASTPKMITKINAFGHEIGSHTCTHPNLTLLPQDELEYELKESKEWLENLLEKEITTFAYPYTAYNEKVITTTHKYYNVSRGGGYLYIGLGDVTQHRVHFNSLLTFHWLSLKENLSKYKNGSSLIVLHNERPLKVNFLMSLIKAISPFARFVTISELAEMLKSNACSQGSQAKNLLNCTTCNFHPE